MTPEPSVPDSSDSVASWLSEARAGSADALGKLLEICRLYLLQVANGEMESRLQTKVGASDLVQETYLEAQRIFDRFQGASPTELRSWLRAILLNKLATATRHYRDTAKRQVGREVAIDPEASRPIDPAAPAATASSIMIRQERMESLMAALGRLPEDYRQVIVWRQIENLPFEEMAGRLGRSVDAVRKLWWRALQQLQTELGEDFVTSDDPDTRELDLAEKLAMYDEALKDGRASDETFHPALHGVQDCLRLLEDLWPRNLNNAVTPLRVVLETVAVAPPSAVGGFHIVRELGRGGFGIVYLAHDPQLKRDVAVKVPRSDIQISPELRQRFQREARAAAGLEHPNLVPVYESGEEGSHCYIVSAYCPGINLAQWLHQRSEPAPVADAARLMATLADAVQHAHDRGVLHRDLKPANILLTSGDGAETNSQSRLPGVVPKITDFGLAKLADADLQTQTGATIGTPSYMAPEQAVKSSAAIGPAADVYALGVILYELLTGRLPFIADTPLETLLIVQNEEPVAPSRLRHPLPHDVETICLKCLRKEPGKRYLTATALAADLRRFLDGRPIAARRQTIGERAWRWGRRKPIEAALLSLFVLALIAGVTGISWQWWRAEAHAKQAGIDRDNAVTEREQAERILEQTKVALNRLDGLADSLIGKPETDKTGSDVLKEVLTVYEAILKERSRDPEVRFRTAGASYKVATVYLHMRKWDECDAAFQRSFEILNDLRREDPAHMQYRWLVCQCFIWHGHSLRDRSRYKEAIASYQGAIETTGKVLEEFPDYERFAYLRANVLLNCCGPLRSEQRWDEAQRFQEESLKLQRKLASGKSGKSYRGELALGLDSYAMQLLRRGQAKEAESPCREALAIREEVHGHGLKIEGSVRYLARSYTNLGRVLIALNRLDEAEKSHQKAIELLKRLNAEFPNDALFLDALVSALLHLGDMYADRGSPGKALAVFGEALAVPPQSAEMNNSAAYHLVFSSDPLARDAKTALPFALKAVNQSSQSGNIWNTLGVVYYRHGDWDKSIEAMQKATSLRGEYAGDLLFMAMAFAKKGERKSAQEALERARRLMLKNPNDQELQRFRAEAEALLFDSQPRMP